MANALTFCRIVLSVALLAPPALSPAFLVLYTLAGVTDMLDGYVARRTGAESDLGARLDSIADFVLIVVCLAKILPAISVPTWLWIWIAAIALVKAANAISGFVVERRLVMPHTKANKVAGLFTTQKSIVSKPLPLHGFPAKVLRRHERMAESHARRRVPHDFTDALLRLATLAMSVTILAVALMAIRACSRPHQRRLYGLAA